MSYGHKYHTNNQHVLYTTSHLVVQRNIPQQFSWQCSVADHDTCHQLLHRSVNTEPCAQQHCIRADG